jgi:hypothetical protein
VDSDGDGLGDAFEEASATRFDPNDTDTDGDGTQDADEDDDDDGLSALDEYAVARRAPLGSAFPASPLRKDIVIELDLMANHAIAESLLAEVALAYAAAPVTGLDGASGVGVHFLVDEDAIATQVFDGSFPQRQGFLAAHANGLADGQSPALPLARMVHVVVAAQRADLTTRGGEVVEGEPDVPETSGLFLYLDAIAAAFPQCNAPDGALSVDEAVVGTLIHELGHVLQLGHDTDVGGGINFHNVMSVPTSCTEARERFRGTGNTDASLGATESVSAPRFSAAAASLFSFTELMSVDTATFADTDGREM